jgi:hypothetical protein
MQVVAATDDQFNWLMGVSAAKAKVCQAIRSVVTSLIMLSPILTPVLQSFAAKTPIRQCGSTGDRFLAGIW